MNTYKTSNLYGLYNSTFLRPICKRANERMDKTPNLKASFSKPLQTQSNFKSIDQELKNELLGMEKRDQEIRKQWQRDQNNTMLIKKMNQIDLDNKNRLEKIIESYGWPKKSLVGEDGAQAAWLIVQHATFDLGFQKKCLVLLEDAADKGEASRINVAYLKDRVLVMDGKKQIYGTQAKLIDKKIVFDPIEDEANVDRRRSEIGLMPLAEYKKILEDFYLPK